MENKARILVIEDNPVYARMLSNWLRPLGYGTVVAASAYSARKAITEDSSIACILADIRLPDGDGVDILEWTREKGIDVPYVVMTQNEDVASAVRAMKLGARDYLPKKMLDESLLLDTVKGILSRKRRERTQIFRRTSHAYRMTVRNAGLVAPVPLNVLVTGENGSGKEHIAEMIHTQGSRSSGPFVAVDCGTLSRELAMSELFGYRKGAFTGAVEDKKGLFAQAEGGTLFLDEVGNLPHDVQRQLLRALQERVYRPVGDTVDRECDIRVIAATNENLERAIREGRFREDLFYRLNEFSVHVPPLRECREDILPLAEFFKEKFCGDMGRDAGVFTEEAKMRMLSYRWPGNVRELRNCVRKAVLVSGAGEISAENLGLPESGSPDGATDLSLRNEWDERRRIRDALERTGWNKSKAAELLGISRPTLYEKMGRYDIGQDTGR